MRRAVIFDFDGTLADSMKVVLAIFHDLTGGQYKSRAKDIELFRNKPARQVIKELGIRWWQVPGLMTQGRRAMNSRMSEVQTFPGIVEAIKQLKADGYQMYILSSNSAVNIRRFLKAHDLDGYFKKIQGSAAVFGKVAAIKRIVSTQHLTINDCIYVGDEVRDIQAAKKVGMPILSVSWGYNSKLALEGSEPNIIIDQAGDLPGAIAKLQGV